MLIDEYNVPLENAYFNGFYDQMVSFNGIMDIFLALQKPSTIEKPIHEDITYADIYKSQNNLWNSKYICQWQYQIKKLYIYKNTIREWSLQYLEKQDLPGLVQAFENGDCKTASGIITEQLLDTISFYDYKEDYYHGFIAGLLKHGGKYLIKSNRESGLGRYGLVLKTKIYAMAGQ